MKQLLITLISTYQLISPLRGHCRFYPTCSQYAKIVIKERGMIKGGWLTLLRLLSCQPFYKVKSQKLEVKIAS